MTDEPKPEQIVFAIAKMQNEDEMPMLLIGIPTAAWEYMKDGKTHNFDLRHIGVPIQFTLFGGKDHAEVREAYNTISERLNNGVPLDNGELN